MADSYTSNYAWTLPEVGASADTWGTKWNANFSAAGTGIDAIVKGISNVASAAAVRANNLSDLTNAGTARSNLGLAIGTNVQAYNALLASIAGLSFGTNNYIYGTNANTAAVGTITAFARSILDDVDGAAMRTTLALGSVSILNAVNNAHWSGAALSIANGGTGATDAAGARTALGLAIGTNVQAYSANLATLAGVTVTAAGTALLDDADAAAQRNTLGLGALATLGSVNNANWAGTALSVVNGGTGATSASAARTALGLTIGSDIQAYSGNLAALAAVTVTAAGTALLDDADAAAQRTTLGLGNVENKSSATIRGEISKANVEAALGKTAARVTSGVSSNSGLISWGTAAPGALAEGEIYLRYA